MCALVSYFGWVYRVLTCSTRTGEASASEEKLLLAALGVSCLIITPTRLLVFRMRRMMIEKMPSLEEARRRAHEAAFFYHIFLDVAQMP